jgi:hypothetical protein
LIITWRLAAVGRPQSHVSRSMFLSPVDSVPIEDH